MTFTGSLNVKQTGHAMLHLDKFDEDYLISFPDCKVKGFLSGKLYPELGGTCHIVSSTGLVSEISFSGEGFFSGTRNHFNAKMYSATDKKKSPIYLASGQWSGNFTITNATDENDIITCGPGPSPTAPLQIPDIIDQDPWESRNAWKHVLWALRKGDWQSTIREKTKLEEAQRAMRKKELLDGIQWQPKFFSSNKEDPVFSRLAAVTGWKLQAERTKGIWRFNPEQKEKAVKPYHGDVTPFG
ncbi:hypothetical protein LTR28_010171 [Elasticomyces elasticus]|nr:hypothetical protein LTR28_010171 [Elasticomyces elasticus]